MNGGFFVDSKNRYENFKMLYKNRYFVDKSLILKIFNELLHDYDHCICITKPRRFGKTAIGSMIVAYYSKSKKKEFKEIFNTLKISKESTYTSEYEKTMGNYHTIYIDFSLYHETNDNIYNYLSNLDNKIISELKDVIEDKTVLDEVDKRLEQSNEKSYKLARFLDYLYCKIEERFIFVIDEWDYIFDRNLYKIDERDEFLIYLKYLLKDKSYNAFTYMTGILPIAKRSSGSSLNCFREYSTLIDNVYYKYFGFTEEEVKELCNKHGKIKYEDLKDWYNGYKSINGENIFNSLSVNIALTDNYIGNYWTNTGPMKEVENIINLNVYGIKDDFLRLITGDEIEIKLYGYGVENKQDKKENNETKENNLQNTTQQSDSEKINEIYSAMVVYGFLTYYQGKVKIPNKELLEKFKEILRNKKDFGPYYNLMKDSKEMLEATLEKKTDRICELIKKVHIEKSTINGYYNQITLEFIVKFAYFDAQNLYYIEQEGKSGKGYVDFIFYPKDKTNGTFIILELKVGTSAKQAIKQIHEKEYYYELKDKEYKGKILLVGINCTKTDKEYSCIIEEYNNMNELIKQRNNKRKNTATTSKNNKKKKDATGTTNNKRKNTAITSTNNKRKKTATGTTKNKRKNTATGTTKNKRKNTATTTTNNKRKNTTTTTNTNNIKNKS